MDQTFLEMLIEGKTFKVCTEMLLGLVKSLIHKMIKI